MKEELLKVDKLSVNYGKAAILRSVSVTVNSGKIIGIVGESGSGKSTLIYSALGILGRGGRITDGTILYDGIDLQKISKEEFRRLRGQRLSLIAQDPMQSFHPVRKIRKELQELVKAHEGISVKEAENEMVHYMEKFHLHDPESILDKYAFELSGGMCQRTSIAMAMVLRPQILFADEPTSALDVTVQKQVVEEMMRLREEDGTTIVMVSHNMGVISYMSDEIYVMLVGYIVEYGSRNDVMNHTIHPYSKDLIDVIPKMGRPAPRKVRNEPINKSEKGCPYCYNCVYKTQRCEEEIPDIREIEPEHFVRCWNV